jgi:uncharacterized protein (TIGR00661 family)
VANVKSRANAPPRARALHVGNTDVFQVRIVYGIHGYSRGHAARALAVLPELVKHYDVKVYAGGDAYATLKDRFDVERIPTMRYCYHRGRRSTLRTLWHNLPLFWEILSHGPSVRALKRSLAKFAPTVVISDAECWTHAVARSLKIPRIGFDHFGMMVHCKLDLTLGDWLRSLIDRGVYSLLTGRPERVLISSFYRLETRSPDVEIIPPLLRDEVHQAEPSNGEHLLVYLNQGNVQLTPSVLKALGRSGAPVVLYGTERSGRVGLVSYKPPSNHEFLRDLASCRAVVSTAGNQLVGEALQFGKPMLVIPETTVEQRLNAGAIAKLGIGEVVEFHEVSAERIRAFLDRARGYALKARELKADGRCMALSRLHQWLHELGEQRQERAGLPQRKTGQRRLRQRIARRRAEEAI